MATNFTRNVLLAGAAIDDETARKVAAEYQARDAAVVKAEGALVGATLNRARVLYALAKHSQMTNEDIGAAVADANGKPLSKTRVSQVVREVGFLALAGFDLAYSGSPDPVLVDAYREAQNLRKVTVKGLPSESKTDADARNAGIRARAAEAANVEGSDTDRLAAFKGAVKAAQDTAKASGGQTPTGTRGAGKEPDKTATAEVKVSPFRTVSESLALANRVFGEFGVTMLPDDLATLLAQVQTLGDQIEDTLAAVESARMEAVTK